MEFSSSKLLVTFFLIALLTTPHHISASRTLNPTSNSNTNTDFIRSSCVATTYPKLCFSSLSVHASAIQSSPHMLANTALGVSLSSARSTAVMMRKLSVTPSLTPRESGAMKDCMETLSDTVDELQKSMAHMAHIKGNPNFGAMMSDIQTWVSAALTDENTCTDGFEEKYMNGVLKTTVRGQIVNVAQLTSNSLALINNYAMVHG